MRQRVRADGVHHQFREFLLDLGSLDLEDGSFRARRLAGAIRARHAQAGDLQRHQVDLDFGDAIAEQRIFHQRLAAFLFLCRDVLQVLQLALRRADACNAGALMRQQEFGASPAAILFADEVLHRHFDVLEPDFIDLVLAFQGDDRAHGDAGGMHVDQQEGNAVLFLTLAGGAHQAETHVGPLAVRVPGLLAIYDVFVAFALCAGLQRREVRARTRFRVALAPPILAGKNARQVMFLLLVGTERNDDGTHHVQAEWRETWRPCGGALILENETLDRRPAGTPVFHRPAGGQPTLLEQDFLPTHVIFLAQPLVFEDFPRQVAGQMAADEFAHFAAKCGLFLRVIQVHRGVPGGIGAAGCFSGVQGAKPAGHEG